MNATGKDLFVSLSNAADGDAAGAPARDRDMPASAWLGLELAQAVMQLHHGSIRMSKGASQGRYEFVLRPPLAAEPETRPL